MKLNKFIKICLFRNNVLRRSGAFNLLKSFKICISWWVFLFKITAEMFPLMLLRLPSEYLNPHFSLATSRSTCDPCNKGGNSSDLFPSVIIDCILLSTPVIYFCLILFKRKNNYSYIVWVIYEDWKHTENEIHKERNVSYFWGCSGPDSRTSQARSIY